MSYFNSINSMHYNNCGPITINTTPNTATTTLSSGYHQHNDDARHQRMTRTTEEYSPSVDNTRLPSISSLLSDIYPPSAIPIATMKIIGKQSDYQHVDNSFGCSDERKLFTFPPSNPSINTTISCTSIPTSSPITSPSS